MAYENNEQKIESVFSSKIRAGKRRTYFFDVRATRNNDYFLTITESRRKFNENGYERHKIFLYKEDFNKFAKGLNEAVDYVKTELMPDYDFDSFSHEGYDENASTVVVVETENEIVNETVTTEATVQVPLEDTSSTAPTNDTEDVDKW